MKIGDHDTLVKAHEHFSSLMEKRMKALFLSAVNQTVKGSDFSAAIDKVNAGSSPVLSADLMQTLTSVELPVGPMVTVVRDSIIGGGRIAGANSGVVSKALEFDSLDQAVIEYARSQSARMVTDVNRGTQAAVQQAVADAVSNGTAPYELAELLKLTVGLTAQSAQAVETYRQGLLGTKGLTRARVNRMAREYANRLLQQRANTIATNEVSDAVNGGQDLYWQQAQKRGDISHDVVRLWIATTSDRTCATCMALNGETAPIGGAFSDGTFRPPAHISCRCTTGLVRA